MIEAAIEREGVTLGVIEGVDVLEGDGGNVAAAVFVGVGENDGVIDGVDEGDAGIESV